MEQILERVAARRVREFIREGLDREAMVNVRNRAQPADPHVRLRRAILRAKIGNVVGNIGPALPQVAGIAIDGIHVESRGDGRKNGALQPGCRLSATVQRGFHVHGRYRVVVVELDVVLARPDDFYGTAHFLREHSGLGDVIRLGLAPEAAS